MVMTSDATYSAACCWFSCFFPERGCHQVRVLACDLHVLPSARTCTKYGSVYASALTNTLSSELVSCACCHFFSAHALWNHTWRGPHPPRFLACALARATSSRIFAFWCSMDSTVIFSRDPKAASHLFKLASSRATQIHCLPAASNCWKCSAAYRPSRRSASLQREGNKQIRFRGSLSVWAPGASSSQQDQEAMQFDLKASWPRSWIRSARGRGRRKRPHAALKYPFQKLRFSCI